MTSDFKRLELKYKILDYLIKLLIMINERQLYQINRYNTIIIN